MAVRSDWYVGHLNASTDEAVRAAVCGLVVTWQPDDGVIERLERLRGQVDHLILIDNGSTTPAAGWIADWAATVGARYVRNERNLGLAGPFNVGARMALDDGCDWLCIVDQDTTVSASLVADMLAARVTHPRPSRVAMIGPVTHWQTSKRCTDRLWTRRQLVISSGSLLSLSAWQEVGGFREDYYVDMVEAEYCLRLGTRGYRVILACRATIDHRIGQPTTHRFLGHTLSVSNHSAWRRYYITRNRIRTWLSYWRHAPAWVAFDAFGHFRSTDYMVMFEQGRRAKLAATAAGARDGLLGRMGELVTKPVEPEPTGPRR